ncbi:MAG TPA: trimethylamine methyltransferase family protein, partial [Anaerolineales bacterium]
EFVAPMLSDRNPFNRWVALGRPDLYDKAREKVEEILSRPQNNPLSAGVVGKLESIIQKVERV